jgi:hypothetical protein
MQTHYHDLLEIARLVSWCVKRDYLIKTCLDHLSQQLSKRARCVLLGGDELKMSCWVGRYDCPMEQVSVCKESIVWDVVTTGIAVNLTDFDQTKDYKHTLTEKVKIKAIIPVGYIDSVTQEEKRVGALIVDSGKEGIPISQYDFEYLKVVGELIGAAIGKAELVSRLTDVYRKQEAIIRETSHNFRNCIAVVGGLSRRVTKAAIDSELKREAKMLYGAIKSLEMHLKHFEEAAGAMSMEVVKKEAQNHRR